MMTDIDSMIAIFPFGILTFLLQLRIAHDTLKNKGIT